MIRLIQMRTFPPGGLRRGGAVPEKTPQRKRAAGVHRHAGTLAIVVVVATMSAVSASARAAEPQFTPLGASVLAPPQPVRATDGRVHLVYEITLLSVDAGAGTAPLEVQSLDVRARGGRRLLRVAGPEIVMTAGAPLQYTRSLAPGTGGTLWLDVAVPR